MKYLKRPRKSSNKNRDYTKVDLDHYDEKCKLFGYFGVFRLMSFIKFPASFFVGLRLDHADREKVVASIPGGWRSQNPFNCMYWAA